MQCTFCNETTLLNDALQVRTRSILSPGGSNTYMIKFVPKLHCKFRRVVLTPRGHFRPFGKRVVSTPRKGRFNSKGSFDSMEGSK